MRVDCSRISIQKQLQQTKMLVTVQQILKLFVRLSQNTFEFDSVVYKYENLDIAMHRGHINKLLAAKILTGRPVGNVWSHLFIYRKDDGYQIIVTSDKHWNKYHTVMSYSGYRYDMLVIAERIKESNYAATWINSSSVSPAVDLQHSPDGDTKS